MGFSPGDFTLRDGTKVHWELKGAYRVVLWNSDESKKLLDLEFDEARKAFEQLETFILMYDNREHDEYE